MISASNSVSYPVRCFGGSNERCILLDRSESALLLAPHGSPGQSSLAGHDHKHRQRSTTNGRAGQPVSTYSGPRRIAVVAESCDDEGADCSTGASSSSTSGSSSGKDDARGRARARANRQTLAAAAKRGVGTDVGPAARTATGAIMGAGQSESKRRLRSLVSSFPW